MEFSVINRFCNFSTISANKVRPDWFDRKNCFSITEELFEDIHIVFDGNPESHFISEYKNPIHRINVQSGALSFIESLHYGLSISKNDDHILYFLEDDYLHRKNKKIKEIIIDGLNINKDGYISLYDHSDKYSSMYEHLSSQIFVGKYCHWRTTPSTTDTFAIRAGTLKKHLKTFIKWSTPSVTGANYSKDHNRCLELWKLGIPLLTSIPGYATHCETAYLDPLFSNWLL